MTTKPIKWGKKGYLTQEEVEKAGLLKEGMPVSIAHIRGYSQYVGCTLIKAHFSSQWIVETRSTGYSWYLDTLTLLSEGMGVFFPIQSVNIRPFVQ